MTKYIITGSLGNISKPIAEGLLKEGKNVSIITSDPGKVSAIEQLGAHPLVGSVQDAAFVNKAFRDAEVVYTMIPPIWKTTDWRASQNEVGRTYANAITEANIKYVVNLSALGAESASGNGPVNGLHDFEQLLNNIPSLNVKHLRPAYFYHNFVSLIELIKTAGIIGGNFGGDKIFLVHPRDIAAAALEELVKLNFKGNSVRYVISDERTGIEVAEVLGNAIGKKFPWVIFTDQEQKDGLLQAGLSGTIVENFVEMGTALRTGYMDAEVRKNKPPFSPTKLEDFAGEFAAVFNSKAKAVLS